MAYRSSGKFARTTGPYTGMVIILLASLLAACAPNQAAA